MKCGRLKIGIIAHIDKCADRRVFHCRNLMPLPAIADDTGLEVDYLNGAPGVRSARFAGENATSDNNVNLLLNKLFYSNTFVKEEGRRTSVQKILPKQSKHMLCLLDC